MSRPTPASAGPVVLVYEPHAGLHQPVYARLLLRRWDQFGRPGRLIYSAPPALIEAVSPDVSGTSARLVPLQPDEVAPPGSGISNALGINRMRPIGRLVREHRPDRVLVMSFEHLVGPLSRRSRLPGHPPMSALAFHTGADAPSASGSRSALRALFLRAALRHPDLERIYTLDPTAPPAIRALGARGDITFVPDPIPEPVPIRPTPVIRSSWGVDDGRLLAVLTGTVNGRKGVVPLLDALLRLPPETASRLSVVRAGRVSEPYKEAVAQRLERVRSETRVQVIDRDTFLSDADLAELTAAADLVLLPYPAQIGSSGFLMRAAGAETPVITQAGGLMGWLTRTHGLGQTVDTRAPGAIAVALVRFVDDPTVDFRPDGARALARSHTPAAFAGALLRPLFDES